MHVDAQAEGHSQVVFLAVEPVNVLSGTSASHHSSLYWTIPHSQTQVFHPAAPEYAVIYSAMTNTHHPDGTDWSLPICTETLMPAVPALPDLNLPFNQLLSWVNI